MVMCNEFFHGELMRLVCLICCLASAAGAAPGLAADAEKPGPDAQGNVLMIQVAPAAIHYHKSPDYKGHSWLAGAEWQYPSHWLGGYSYFKNSFDQDCHYVYAGYWWRINEKDPNWYLKVTGGAIEGYRGRFKDKLSYNSHGIAPAIVPGLGYKMKRFNMQVNTLGTAGIMVTVGYDLLP
jgi:hypothetical protein